MKVDIEKLIEEIEHHAELYSDPRHFRIIGEMPMSTVLSTVADILSGYKERLDESEATDGE